MATNKHAMIRYQALDRCFSKRYGRFYIDDLIEACNKAIYEFTGSTEGVKRRTIFSDIKYMESKEGWSAPIKRVYDGSKRCYYIYEEEDFSINNKPLTDAQIDTIDEALVMLNRFKGVEGFDWIDDFVANFQDKLGRKRNTTPVIGYEKNPYLKGLDYLSVVYNYIVNKQVLKITYHPFDKDEMVYHMHPYYLKQYNNRWFLFGITEQDRSALTNLPLDRIVQIEPVDIDYVPNESFDFEEYFDDVVGVSVPRKGEPQKVVLKFGEIRYPYIITKPIHPSQKELDRLNRIIELEVFITRELKSIILSFGEQVEVLEPQSLRDEIGGQIASLQEKYNCAK